MKIELGPKKYQLFIHCSMVECYTKFGCPLSLIFNIQKNNPTKIISLRRRVQCNSTCNSFSDQDACKTGLPIQIVWFFSRKSTHILCTGVGMSAKITLDHDVT